MAKDGAECGNCATVNIVVNCALAGGGDTTLKKTLFFCLKW